MHHCFTGFVIYGGTSRGAATYLADTRNPVFIAKSVLYISQTLLGDAFMVRTVLRPDHVRADREIQSYISGLPHIHSLGLELGRGYTSSSAHQCRCRSVVYIREALARIAQSSCSHRLCILLRARSRCPREGSN